MNQEVEVIEVESRRLMDEFILYPFKLYKNEPNWVPPLISERKEFFNTNKNPFFRAAKAKYFLAKRGEETVGRIATCINYNHNEFHMEATGFFGFFDCINDYDVAYKLLKVAMIKLKAEGMDRMRGPANFSTNHEIGFLIDGFDRPPTIMNPWNPPYLPQLAEKFGLKKAMDLHGYLVHRDVPISERQLRVVEKIKERSKIKIRTVDFSHFEAELKIVNQIYNRAWERNWGFVPMSEQEFCYMARQLKEIVDPALVFIAEVDGDPAGFCMAVPDINQVLIKLNGKLFPFGIFRLIWDTKIKKKITGVRLLIMGVVQEYRKRGIDSIFYVETHLRGVERGYQWGELSWILETNELMCRAAENMGGVLYKKYRMVEMPI